METLKEFKKRIKQDWPNTLFNNGPRKWYFYGVFGDREGPFRSEDEAYVELYKLHQKIDNDLKTRQYYTSDVDKLSSKMEKLSSETKMKPPNITLSGNFTIWKRGERLTRK